MSNTSTFKTKPILTVENPGNWPEDFAHENGQYLCRCHDCGENFTGYKRRVTCKVCASKPLTPDQERDALWCQALMSSGLDLETLNTILSRFKELRRK
jgi:hypothetical protein